MPPTSSERVELVWEKWHPSILAVGAAAIAFFLADVSTNDGFRDLLQSAVNISAITVGFLATAKSILFSISQKEVITGLKQTEKWSLLIDYMMYAIYSAFLLAISSGCLLLVKFKDPEHWKTGLFCLWAFLAVLAFMTSLRVIRFFARILKMK